MTACLPCGFTDLAKFCYSLDILHKIMARRRYTAEEVRQIICREAAGSEESSDQEEESDDNSSDWEGSEGSGSSDDISRGRKSTTNTRASTGRTSRASSSRSRASSSRSRASSSRSRASSSRFRASRGRGRAGTTGRGIRTHGGSVGNGGQDGQGRGDGGQDGQERGDGGQDGQERGDGGQGAQGGSDADDSDGHDDGQEGGEGRARGRARTRGGDAGRRVRARGRGPRLRGGRFGPHGLQGRGDGGRDGQGGGDGGQGAQGRSDDDDSDDGHDDDNAYDPIFVAANMQPPQKHDFTVQNVGIQVDTNGFSPEDYYKLYLTDDLVDRFVRETNRMAQQWLATHQPSRYSRTRRWEDVDAAEMRKFVAITLCMGLIKVPKIQLYWATSSQIFQTPIFRVAMDRNRYLLILRFWHFENNQDHIGTDDRLYKVRRVIEHLNDRFQEVYIPSEHISLDESLLLWKGRLLFRQYIPLKRARYGVKQYVLAEDTGYVVRLKVYMGRNGPQMPVPQNIPPGMTKTDQTVLGMLEGYLDKGYTLYVDNFYSSTKLFHFLHDRTTNAVGTLRKNRAPRVARTTNVPKGESRAWRAGELLVIKFHDRKEGYIITTCHDEATTQVRRRGRLPRQQQPQQPQGPRPGFDQRPNAVIDYNTHMGGVDRVDQV